MVPNRATHHELNQLCSSCWFFTTNCHLLKNIVIASFIIKVDSYKRKNFDTLLDYFRYYFNFCCFQYIFFILISFPNYSFFQLSVYKLNFNRTSIFRGIQHFSFFLLFFIHILILVVFNIFSSFSFIFLIIDYCNCQFTTQFLITQIFF